MASKELSPSLVARAIAWVTWRSISPTLPRRSDSSTRPWSASGRWTRWWSTTPALSSVTLSELEAGALDAAWAVNVRASLLLVRAFAEQYRPTPQGGRVVLFSSGQHLGPTRSPTPRPRAPCSRSRPLWPTPWPSVRSRSTASTRDRPTPAGPQQTRPHPWLGTCPAAAGTRPRRPPTSWPYCSRHRRPRSPVRSSTPRPASAASPLIPARSAGFPAQECRPRAPDTDPLRDRLTTRA